MRANLLQKGDAHGETVRALACSGFFWRRARWRRGAWMGRPVVVGCFVYIILHTARACGRPILESGQARARARISIQAECLSLCNKQLRRRRAEGWPRKNISRLIREGDVRDSSRSSASNGACCEGRRVGEWEGGASPVAGSTHNRR